MDPDLFWNLIDRARHETADLDALNERLVEKLARLPSDDIEMFDRIFWQRMQELYTWEMWGVGCLAKHDDEGAFAGFRGWVITQGREVFEASLTDPDSLAPLIYERAASYKFSYAARTAYEQVKGSELPTATLNLFAEPSGSRIRPSELSARFPKVALALRPE